MAAEQEVGGEKAMEQLESLSRMAKAVSEGRVIDGLKEAEKLAEETGLKEIVVEGLKNAFPEAAEFIKEEKDQIEDARESMEKGVTERDWYVAMDDLGERLGVKNGAEVGQKFYELLSEKRREDEVVGETKVFEDEEAKSYKEEVEQRLYRGKYACRFCGGWNEGNLECQYCGRRGMSEEAAKEIDEAVVGYMRTERIARELDSEQDRRDVWKNWYEKYGEKDWLDVGEGAKVYAELVKGGRKKEEEERREPKRSEEVDEVKKEEQKNLELKELPTNKEELFIEVRRLAKEALSSRADFIEAGDLLSQLGLLDVGLQKYSLPSEVSHYREILKAEVELRVRLHNALLARKGADLGARADSWMALKGSPNWDKTKLRADERGNDYKTIGRLAEAGGFSVEVMDKALQWLWQTVESGEYKDPQESYRKMMERFNRDGNQQTRDALDMAWDFWQVHEADVSVNDKSPIANAVEFGKKFIEKGYLSVGAFLKLKQMGGSLLAGRGFQLRPEMDKKVVARLAVDGISAIEIEGETGRRLMAEGRLLRRLGERGINRSAYEVMVNSVILGRASFELFAKMGEVKSEEIANGGVWYGWKNKLPVETVGMLDKAGAERVKLVYAKALLWSKSTFNEEAVRARKYWNPGAVRLAYHGVADMGILTGAELVEFREFAEKIWDSINVQLELGNSTADKNVRSYERKKDFKSKDAMFAGRA